MTGRDGPLQPELRVAVLAAETAGELLTTAFSRPMTVQRKGRHDATTPWDGQAETAIMATIGALFPGDRRLGEESGLAVPVAHEPDATARTWIVDPLDGSVNFASGVPFWCVSVALAVGSEIVLGVIGDPLRGEMYAAIRGSGTWSVTSGRQLSLRRIRRIDEAVVDAGPGDPDDSVAVSRIGMLQAQVRAVRALGSTALSLAMLATGALDGVVQLQGLAIVDIAAGGLIAAEAGAVVSDVDGRPVLRLDAPGRRTGVVAASPGIHRRLIRSTRVLATAG